MKSKLLAAGLCLFAVPAMAGGEFRHVHVVHDPQAAQQPALPAEEGMIIYVDPDTGEMLPSPPPGMRVADFPELRFDPSRITEEVQADGTVTTWLNGAGMEAQILVVDTQGQPRVACSSVLESATDFRRQALQRRASDER